MAEEDRFRVPLDAEMIQVLASDTRRDLLRLLRKRRMTLSELAREVDLKKPTVLEHLRRLTDADLVARDEDDERLWVYYELTHQGQRILSPDRTRLYLAIGTIATAAIVAVAALVVSQTFLASPGGPGAPDVAFDVGDEDAIDYPAAADGVDAGSGAPDGFVRIGPGTDEVTWWQELDGSLAVRLGETADGGTLALRRAGETRTALTAAVESDRAVIAASSLDELPSDRYDLRYRPEGASEWVTLSANLTVATADVQVVAPGLIAGEPGQIQVASTPPEAIDRATVRAEEATLTATDGGTVRTFDLEAASPGQATVTVGRRAPVPVPVAPHLATDVTADADRLHLQVTGPDGGGVPDVVVRIDGQAQGFTDARGEVTVDRPTDGGHELALSDADGHRAVWPIAVMDAGVARSPAPSIDLVPTRLGPGDATVDVRVGLDDAPARNVTIVVSAAGSPVRVTRRQIPASGNATLSATLPALPADVAATLHPRPMPPLRVDGTLQTVRSPTAPENLTNPVTVSSLDVETLGRGDARLSVTADNPSPTPAGRRLAVLVDGESRTHVTVEVPPGQSVTRTVPLQLDAGEHRVTVGELEIQAVGSAGDQAAEPALPGPGLLAVAAAGLVAALSHRRR